MLFVVVSVLIMVEGTVVCWAVVEGLVTSILVWLKWEGVISVSVIGSLWFEDEEEISMIGVWVFNHAGASVYDSTGSLVIDPVGASVVDPGGLSVFDSTSVSVFDLLLFSIWSCWSFSIWSYWCLWI
jgi:hypothetical protein